MLKTGGLMPVPNVYFAESQKVLPLSGLGPGLSASVLSWFT